MAHNYDFDELYPGRFIKGVMFKGKVVTLTITDLHREEMPDPKGKGGKSHKVILSFKERDKQLVTNKLNCTALMLMFGRQTKDWIGKRVSFYGEKGTWFGKKQEAIRVYGSPDILKDIMETVRLGLDNYQFHLRRTKPGKKTQEIEPELPPEEPEEAEEEKEAEEEHDPETGEVPMDEEEKAQIRETEKEMAF